MYSKNREDFITIELAAGKNLKVIKLGPLFNEAGKGGSNKLPKIHLSDEFVTRRLP
jgi:hypothetical protein